MIQRSTDVFNLTSVWEQKEYKRIERPVAYPKYFKYVWALHATKGGRLQPADCKTHHTHSVRVGRIISRKICNYGKGAGCSVMEEKSITRIAGIKAETNCIYGVF